MGSNTCSRGTSRRTETQGEVECGRRQVACKLEADLKKKTTGKVFEQPVVFGTKPLVDHIDIEEM